MSNTSFSNLQTSTNNHNNATQQIELNTKRVLDTHKNNSTEQLEAQSLTSQAAVAQNMLLNNLNISLMTLNNCLNLAQSLSMTASMALGTQPSLNLLNGLKPELPLLAQAAESVYQPALQVSEDESNTTITAELAGISEKDIQITLKGDHLIISGIKPCLSHIQKPNAINNYQLGQTWSGRFQRSISLGYTPESKQISAQFAKGILTVSVNKPLAARSETIKVTTLN